MEEQLRPYLDGAVDFARTASRAALAMALDVGDIAALDRCIDRLDSSDLTRPVANACTEMRVEAVQYCALLRQQLQMIDQMRRIGGDPLIGRQVAIHGEVVERRVDRLRIAAEGVRATVRHVTAELEKAQLDG